MLQCEDTVWRGNDNGVLSSSDEFNAIYQLPVFK